MLFVPYRSVMPPVMPLGGRLAGLDFFENLARITPAVFEVQDDVIDSGFAQLDEKTKHELPPAPIPEVDRRRRFVRVVGEIDVK
jgi:hypothetical protein